MPPWSPTLQRLLPPSDSQLDPLTPSNPPSLDPTRSCLLVGNTVDANLEIENSLFEAESPLTSPMIEELTAPESEPVENIDPANCDKELHTLEELEGNKQENWLTEEEVVERRYVGIEKWD